MRARRRLPSIVLSVLLAVAAAAAEQTAYQIVSGDVLDVQIWREPDLSGPHPVDAAGAVHHVLVGSVHAAGRTAEAVAGELRERLEQDYLRQARVRVTVVESAQRRASALGAVVRPGVYPVREHTRVLDLLSAAGGLAADAARSATLLRVAQAEAAVSGAPRERLEIDLAALLDRGDLEANPTVGPGDVLVVARGAPGDAVPAARADTPRIRVVGEVARPGVYALSEATTLLDAVLVAGGLTEYGAGNRARLIRGEGAARSETRIRIGDLLDGRENAENPALRAGDLIVVPESFF